jgi:hypothetical protein
MKGFELCYSGREELQGFPSHQHLELEGHTESSLPVRMALGVLINPLK